MNMFLQSATEEINLEHPPDPGRTGYQDPVSSLTTVGPAGSLLGGQQSPEPMCLQRREVWLTMIRSEGNSLALSPFYHLTIS